MKPTISDYQPGQRFYIPATGQIAYLDPDMRLLDTGQTCHDPEATDFDELPTLTEEDAIEYQEANGQIEGELLHLDIYEVIEDSMIWPKVDTITGHSEQECFDKALQQYDQDLYHWTNPY